MSKQTQKWFWFIVLVVAVLGMLWWLGKGSAHANQTEKITVCHKTHSDTNPWVEQTINANELESHLANGDFVVNADHPCPPVAPSPTLGQPTATPTPTKEPKCWEDEDCEPTVTPTVTPSPEASPSPTPIETQGPGNIPSNPSTDTTEAQGAATCNIAFSAPILDGFQADGNGSVTFSWWGVSNIDKYSITYGYSPDALIYGEDNIPSSSTSIELNGLIPGHNVWAQVQAWRNGCEESSNLFDPRVR